jgi:CO/xanthine dehydrogenase Mo-binding subunit
MGKPATRLDGPAKVTGAAKYAYDVQPEAGSTA